MPCSNNTNKEALRRSTLSSAKFHPSKAEPISHSDAMLHEEQHGLKNKTVQQEVLPQLSRHDPLQHQVPGLQHTYKVQREASLLILYILLLCRQEAHPVYKPFKAIQQACPRVCVCMHYSRRCPLETVQQKGIRPHHPIIRNAALTLRRFRIIARKATAACSWAGSSSKPTT